MEIERLTWRGVRGRNMGGHLYPLHFAVSKSQKRSVSTFAHNQSTHYTSGSQALIPKLNINQWI